MKLCTIPGCGRDYHAKGMCHRHYECNARYGDPLYLKRRPLQFNGKALSIREWAKVIGLEPSSLSQRLHSGWSVERALTTPRGKFGPHAKAIRPSPPQQGV